MMVLEMKDERILKISRVAGKDNKSNDSQYNRGLKAIKDFGYEHVMGDPDVKYWCMCNNL